MNKCIFLGRLTKDFELRTGNVNVARSSMAIDSGKDRDAVFINLVAFGNTAETLEKWGKKGKRFAFETHVQTGSYEKDGHKVYTTDFIIDRFYFADSKNESTEEKVDEFMKLPDGLEEELPFV